MLGKRRYTLHRQAQKFIKYDEESMRRLVEQNLNSAEYISKARQEIEQQEELLRADRRSGRLDGSDQLWDGSHVDKGNS
jgi:CPA2 family monovalent cation:H+ antiporter-2/glutathione-regulated potassium-efflux system protein KefB